MKPRNQSGKLSQIPIVAFLENFNFNEKDANQNNATRSILVANSRQVFVLKCSLRQGLFTKICVLYIFLQIYVAQNVCFIYMLYQESQLDIFLETKLVLLFSRQNVYSISVSSCGSNNDMILHFFSDQAHNVTIHNKERSLRAGSQHEFTCEALGSRPAAVITWWFDDKEIEAEIDNVQIVSLI